MESDSNAFAPRSGFLDQRIRNALASLRFCSAVRPCSIVI
jgi:hypothetical protein